MNINRATSFFIQFLFIAFNVQAQIQVTDCASKIPVPQANCYNLHAELMGTTDDKGWLRVPVVSFPLFLQATGYETLTIPDSASLQNICMSHIAEQLDEVEISSRKMTIGEYLLSLYEGYKEHYIGKDTILYYRFTYTITFPDSNWSENTHGYIAYRIHKHSKISFRNVLEDLSIIQYNYTATNKEFTRSKVYKKINVVRPLLVLSFEMMSDIFGTVAWKIITDPNSRKLALKQSGSDEIFSGYSLKDKNYVTEQLVFDEQHVLKSVDFYTPNLFDEDGSMLFKPYDFSRRNTENSYYHTSYQYKTTPPYMLQTAKSRSIILNRKVSYEVNFELELLDFIPEQKINIGLYQLAKGPVPVK